MTERIDIVAFTQNGVRTALAIKQGMEDLCPDIRVSSTSRFANDEVMNFGSLAEWTKQSFAEAEALIFVSATGIAVRAIAPHLKDKMTDPAVVCVDEAGQFAVSLVSGHVGGANQLARKISQICDGQAVVSTATDVNGKFAIDEWATGNQLQIMQRKLAKEISASLLEDQSIGFISDFPVRGNIPQGLSQEGGMPLGAFVSWNESMLPFPKTLHLIPKTIALGIGCKRGTDPRKLEDEVFSLLESCGVSPSAIAVVASIDLKSDEGAILNFADKIGCDLRFYSADQLARTPGQFKESEFVKKTTGVGNVCERSAMQAAIDLRSSFEGKGWQDASLTTLIPKTPIGGITVSLVGIIPPLSFDLGNCK